MKLLLISLTLVILGCQNEPSQPTKTKRPEKAEDKSCKIIISGPDTAYTLEGIEFKIAMVNCDCNTPVVFDLDEEFNSPHAIRLDQGKDTFGVSFHEAGNQTVYVRQKCNGKDIDASYNLHVLKNPKLDSNFIEIVDEHNVRPEEQFKVDFNCVNCDDGKVQLSCTGCSVLAKSYGNSYHVIVGSNMEITFRLMCIKETGKSIQVLTKNFTIPE